MTYFIYNVLKRIYQKLVPPPLTDEKQEVLDFLVSHGVETEYGNVRLIGMPIINKVPGARIIIGKGVTLVSKNDYKGCVYNPAGINHPVMLSSLMPGAVLVIKDNVGISGSSIVATKKVEIGENTLLGNNSNIYDTDFHCIDAIARNNQKSIDEAQASEVCIGKDCWVGANTTILKGCIIGDETVIGAMSLVNKSIPSKVIAGGVPAKVLKEL